MFLCKESQQNEQELPVVNTNILDIILVPVKIIKISASDLANLKTKTKKQNEKP